MQPPPASSAHDLDLAGRYLTFRLGSEIYGIGVLAVQEIIRTTAITSVPQLPPHLRGVINLRGRIIPVVDLRRRFGLSTGCEGGRACIVVVQIRIGTWGPVPMGLVVDAVEEVLAIEEADLSPPPDFGGTVDIAFLLGIARVRGEVVVLLDLVRILAGERLAA